MASRIDPLPLSYDKDSLVKFWKNCSREELTGTNRECETEKKSQKEKTAENRKKTQSLIANSIDA